MRLIKLLLLIIILSGLTAYSQDLQPDSLKIDSTFYTNGQLYRLIDVGYYDGVYKMNGRYLEYTEDGKILLEGNYEVKSDSVNCIDCFGVNKDSSLVQILKSDFNEVRTGIWKYYYSNGSLKESGQYSSGIRISAYAPLFSDKTQFRFAERPIPSGYGPEYLKHGPWEYYDENGYLIKVIWYFEGRVLLEEFAPSNE